MTSKGSAYYGLQSHRGPQSHLGCATPTQKRAASSNQAAGSQGPNGTAQSAQILTPSQQVDNQARHAPVLP